MANNLKFHKVNTKPSSGMTNGSIYFVKDEGKIYVYNNGWEDYVKTADILKGFSGRRTALSWGALKNQNFITCLETSNRGALAFTDSNSMLNCQIDGAFYQNEGNYKVLDENSIKTTSIPEANLTWGGKNFYANYSCIDAAMIPELGANRFAFLQEGGITIKYSRDGGETWINYDATGPEKVALFSHGKAFYIGGKAEPGVDKSNHQLRVTINTPNARIYTQINKLALYVTTNGSIGTTCDIEIRLQSDVQAGNDTWVKLASGCPINGWSGWNIINTKTFTTYGNTANNQYGNIRFTFSVKSHNSELALKYNGFCVSKIMAFGGMGWVTASNMASTGHLYSYDSSQNAIFPAQITATQFNGPLQGNANTATQASLVTWEEYN